MTTKSVQPTTWKYSTSAKEDPALAKTLGISAKTISFYFRCQKIEKRGRFDRQFYQCSRLKHGPLVDMGYVGNLKTLVRRKNATDVSPACLSRFGRRRKLS